MPTYHHIRYAKAARFEELELILFEEPMNEDYVVVAFPQNKHRLEHSYSLTFAMPSKSKFSHTRHG